MPDFNSTRADNERHSRVLISADSQHSAVLRPDSYATLKCDVSIANYGVLKAGAVIEFVGDMARLFAGRYTTAVFVIEGVEVPAALLCKPYAPLMPEMVVSPWSGELVAADSSIGRRVLASIPVVDKGE